MEDVIEWANYLMRRGRKGAVSPEEWLYGAILAQQILDACGRVSGVRKASKEFIQEAAQSWFFKSDFYNITVMAGFDPDWVEQKLCTSETTREWYNAISKQIGASNDRYH